MGERRGRDKEWEGWEEEEEEEGAEGRGRRRGRCSRSRSRNRRGRGGHKEEGSLWNLFILPPFCVPAPNHQNMHGSTAWELVGPRIKTEPTLVIPLSPVLPAPRQPGPSSMSIEHPGTVPSAGCLSPRHLTDSTRFPRYDVVPLGSGSVYVEWIRTGCGLGSANTIIPSDWWIGILVSALESAQTHHHHHP